MNFERLIEFVENLGLPETTSLLILTLLIGVSLGGILLGVKNGLLRSWLVPRDRLETLKLRLEVEILRSKLGLDPDPLLVSPKDFNGEPKNSLHRYMSRPVAKRSIDASWYSVLGCTSGLLPGWLLLAPFYEFLSLKFMLGYSLIAALAAAGHSFSLGFEDDEIDFFDGEAWRVGDWLFHGFSISIMPPIMGVVALFSMLALGIAFAVTVSFLPGQG